MRTLVDLRFGPGTWQAIVDERAKRIREAKEAAAEAERKRLEEAAHFEEVMKQVVMTGAVVLMTFGFFVFLFKVVL